MTHPLSYLLLFGTALMAGAINSVAGGGTLLTYPALFWAGVPAVDANATSTVALVPGSLSAVLGLPGEMRAAGGPAPHGAAEPPRRSFWGRASSRVGNDMFAARSPS